MAKTRRPLDARAPHVAVVGAGSCDASLSTLAEEVGRHLARRGAVLVCGGLGGVMEAACRGAKSARGLTLGILPSLERSEANRFVDVAIPTGLGEARNALVVRASDALIAVGGEFGTLSEIALALKAGKRVVGLRTWELLRAGRKVEAIVPAADAGQAVDLALSTRRAPRPRR